MKILNAHQLKIADAETIVAQQISEEQFMERASLVFSRWFNKHFKNFNTVYIFCGPGNNGGDGFCIARHLFQKGHHVNVIICQETKNPSVSYSLNLERLKKLNISHKNYSGHFPQTTKQDIIIDAILGYGLNREPQGILSEIIQQINFSEARKISVDVPSGFFMDKQITAHCVHADFAFSFHSPKLGFLFPENQTYLGKWEYAPIGLSETSINKLHSEINFLTRADIKPLLIKRNLFDHKGKFGHALVIAGSIEMSGAAALCGKSCLVTGAGLVTISSAKSVEQIHELMYLSQENLITALTLNKFNALCIGPGLGINTSSILFLETVLQYFHHPIVIDADALNIISENKQLLNQIHPQSILTPHPKEFERLFGKTENSYELLALQKEMSIKYQIYIVLKRAYTCISCPDGTVYFNSTGNPGMATAGSGDVLTGMITSFIAQNYTPLNATLIATFLHGLSADLAMKPYQQNIIASDIISSIQNAIIHVQSEN